jgi:hypothetical protein
MVSKMSEINGVVVVVGDPINGVTVYGPYASIDDAINIWEVESEVDWWVAPLRTNGNTIDIADCDRPWCAHCKNGEE